MTDTLATLARHLLLVALAALAAPPSSPRPRAPAP